MYQLLVRLQLGLVRELTALAELALLAAGSAEGRPLVVVVPLVQGVVVARRWRAAPLQGLCLGFRKKNRISRARPRIVQIKQRGITVVTKMFITRERERFRKHFSPDLFYSV